MAEHNMPAEPFDEQYVEYLRSLLEGGGTDELRRRLKTVHPSDLADALDAFRPAERARLFSLLQPGAAADVLAELDAASRGDLIEDLDPAVRRTVLDELEPDQAADVIGELEPDHARQALAGLDDRSLIESLLSYPPDTAGGLMTTEFVVLPQRATVAQALKIARKGPESTHRDTLYVTDDDDRPLGRVPLARLVFSPPETPVEAVMERNVHAVTVLTDREEVAEIVRRYDLLSLPVVEGPEGRLCGIITVDDVLDAAAEEAAEDMYRLAGTGATDPLHQPVLRRAALRLPWLLVTLVPGFLVGQIMRWLGYDPGGTTALLLFVPVMIEMAGNVSLQSSTIMVRALATGEVRGHRTPTILAREVAVAAIVGVGCGTIAGLVGYAFFGGDVGFAVVTAFSMFCGMIAAAVSGTLVPLACDGVGVDPALASGPFVTSLNDITGTLIYLGLGANLLRFFA